ncbi:MAG TPA: hypothetical protein DGT21_05505 [Armatimonadetes bacterium]|nr:hypothetical protein [Armatimonadota bacterium]
MRVPGAAQEAGPGDRRRCRRRVRATAAGCMQRVETTTQKLLIIDADGNDFALLRNQFGATGASDFEFAHSNMLSHALQLLDYESFAAIVLDLELPDSVGLDTLLQTLGRAPDIPIIIRTRANDDSLALMAVQQGAQDYLVKGSADDERLVRAVRYAIERTRVAAERAAAACKKDGGRVISFIGGKGGTGATTVSSNIAAALASFERSVALVELRTDFGTLALQLRREPTETIADLLRTPADNLDRLTIDQHLFALPYGPRVLFSPQRFEEFPEVEADHASTIIDHLEDTFDFVIIDLPSSTNTLNQLALRRSDYCCVTTQPMLCSVRAARARIQQLLAWDIGRSRVGAVVVTMAPTGTALQLPGVQGQLDCDIIGVMPPAPDACIAAMDTGQPLVLHQPEQIASVTLTEMAQRLAMDDIEPMRL